MAWHQASSDSEVMAALHGLLLRCGGADRAPEPDGLVRSRWGDLVDAGAGAGGGWGWGLGWPVEPSRALVRPLIPGLLDAHQTTRSFGNTGSGSFERFFRPGMNQFDCGILGGNHQAKIHGHQPCARLWSCRCFSHANMLLTLELGQHHRYMALSINGFTC